MADDEAASDARWDGPKWRGLDASSRGREADPELVSASMLTRRGFIGLVGAGLALAGCEGGAPRKVLPYGVTPPELTPGIAQHFATSMVLDGWATGLVVESHEGRPTKIEGNPDHPASLGAAGPFEQASILQLYDPSRARGILHHGQESGWDALRDLLVQPRGDAGAGLRLLLRPTTSPLVGALLGRILERWPQARVAFYSPLAGHGAAGTELAFGRALQPQYDFSRAEVVVALDCDFLGPQMPFSLRYARQWSSRRAPGEHQSSMLRLYAAESMLTVTGSMADERLRLSPHELPVVATLLAAEVDKRRAGAVAGVELADPTARSSDTLAWVRAAARDLARAGAGALVIAGEGAPPVVHALAHALNHGLGSRAAWTTAPVALQLGAATQDLATLTGELRGGGVDTLVMLDVNPVYDAPADLDFAGALAHVRDSVLVGLYQNETAARSTWFAPALHFLESWGDARAWDGTESIVQPLIRPLFGGHDETEILAILGGNATPDAHALVHARWAEDHPGAWTRALQRGVLDESAAAVVTARIDARAVTAALRSLAPTAAAAPLELVFHADYSVYDGRFADLAWLQELPRPLTSLTWDNAALVSPATARRLGLVDGDRVELAAGGAAVAAPVLVAPGQADDVLSVALGYGRAGGEALARGVGFDAYRLRTSSAPWHTGVTLHALGGPRHALARTQLHHDLEGRPIALSTTRSRYQQDPDALTAEHKGPVPSLSPRQLGGGLQWAMSIDLGRCTGCNACVVACQAENNVPIVGKEGVLQRREMHWIRIDTYFSGASASPGVVHQPMLCQHCEKAPCEYVCPVNATVHSPEGLNEMVYNRCVGTRFCSNNCPYKVRRFNWFNWQARVSANQGMVALQRNPDVTVRARGVMEKCTYCVQRIRGAEMRAELDGRALGPGEFQTACQQSCPTRAIEFGSLSHAGTAMMRYRAEPRSYAVLHDQGTEPRTMYLARVDNPPDGNR